MLLLSDKGHSRLASCREQDSRVDLTTASLVCACLVLALAMNVIEVSCLTVVCRSLFMRARVALDACCCALFTVLLVPLTEPWRRRLHQ